MAKTANITVTVYGVDTEKALNSGINSFIQLSKTDYTVEDFTGSAPTYPNTLAAVSIVPSMLATFTGTKIQCVAAMTYNALEAAPFVTFVADTENIEGGHLAAFLFDTSLTVTTTNLTYPVQIELAFYPMY